MSITKVVKGRVMKALLALALIAATSSAVLAQDTTPSKVDIFGGYSWASPGRIGANQNQGVPGTSFKLEGENGFGVSVTYNAHKFVGFTADIGGHYSDQANFSTFMFGPKFMYRTERITPFGELLVGLARLSPEGRDSAHGLGVAVGGGIDLNIAKRVAWRVIQADYIRQQHNLSSGLGVGFLNGARVRGGLVFMLGGMEPLTPPSASCSVQPTEVMAGEPVTATINATGFNPKHTINYDWKSSGGKVTGKDTTANIDTTGMAPGTYTVTGTATDPRVKRNNVASCNATFTIKEPPRNPPTISCSANPTTVTSGDASTITCQGNSPDNRPITYSCTSTAGRISGTGATVQLDTAGAPAGPITVNCTATDDRGLSASTTTSVNVEVPPPPPTASKLNEIAFPNTKLPARVDNTAKAVLDDVALRLQREPDARAVIVGYMDPAEQKTAKRLRIKDLAAQRAVNTKEYLVTDKGIDPGRIDVRTGTAGGTRAEIYLVPAGATFNVENTTPVSETVKPQVEKRRPRR
ncbi:MAG TPA: OmpA family protein [Terriglobales bacterium]|nr:OmpA family protein [Terriglobales bacterium]